MTLFEAYVTNAGKYADYGVEVGEPLKFPTTTEEVQALLKRIGVDGVRYQEIFIVSFDGDVLGLYDYLSEYENLDELNHLAHLLSELDQGELETLEAVLNKGDHTSSVADIINLVHNLDCYDLHPGVPSVVSLMFGWRLMLYFLSSTGSSPRINKIALWVSNFRTSSMVIRSRPVCWKLVELEPLRPFVCPRVRVAMVSLPSSFTINSNEVGSLPPPRNSSVSQLPMMLSHSFSYSALIC